jgi:hypothetical protein
MGYMSGNEETAHEEAETVFRAVKTMFIDMQKIEYGSVNRMVNQLRVCMDLLYWKDRCLNESWSEKKDWCKNAKYYMEIVTGRLNECYVVYEAENSCDLPYDMYEGLVDLLDQCRRWMRQLIEEEPEWGEDGMELEPVRRVTEEEYEGRRSELRNRIVNSERAKKPWSWGWGGSNVRNGPSNGGTGVDMETLLCRLSEMKFDVV